VMMPFNFTKSTFKKSGSSDGLTGHFYEFKGINGSAPIMESANEVTEMKANTPYLYVPDDEPEYWYIYNGDEGVNIFTEGYDGGNKQTESDYWTLKGTYSAKIWDAEDPEIGKAYYINDEGTLEEIVSGMMTTPTSCYLLRNIMDIADVNNDGQVTIEDVTSLVYLILNNSTGPDGDINDDGQVSIADVTALVNIIKGK